MEAVEPVTVYRRKPPRLTFVTVYRRPIRLPASQRGACDGL